MDTMNNTKIITYSQKTLKALVDVALEENKKHLDGKFQELLLVLNAAKASAALAKYEKELKVDYIEAIKYINSAVKLVNTNIYYHDGNKWETIKYQDFITTHINAVPKLKQMVKSCELEFPQTKLIYDNTLPPINHKEEYINMYIESPYKNIDITPDESYLEIVTEYFNVISNHNQDVYKFLMHWCANLLLGYKNDTTLILYTTMQGTGKSSLSELLKCLLNPSVTINVSLQEITTWTGSLENKQLAQIEEISSAQCGKELTQVENSLKNIITNDTMSSNTKNVAQKQVQTTANFILTSNNAVNWLGRRIANIDMSTEWKDKVEKWEQLYEPIKTFNKTTDSDKAKLKALYDYITSHYDPKYNMQQNLKRIYPDKATSKIPPAVEFIKQQYIMQNPLQTKFNYNRVAVYNAYVDYMKNKKFTYMLNTNFYNALSEYNITSYASNGAKVYNMPYEALVEIMKTNQFFDEDEILIIKAREGMDNDTLKKNICIEIDHLKKQMAQLQTKLDSL